MESISGCLQRPFSFNYYQRREGGCEIEAGPLKYKGIESQGIIKFQDCKREIFS